MPPQPRFQGYYLDNYGDPQFRQIYLRDRKPTYSKVRRIIEGLNVRWVLDIGCSFGLLVEDLNEHGIVAHGRDLPIPELQAFHPTLEHSAMSFTYGDVSELKLPIPSQRSAVTVLDSLRQFDESAPLTRLRPEFWIIKETGTRSYIVKQRTPEDQVRFYSPQDLLEIFDGYVAHEIYAPRFSFRVRSPGSRMLRFFNHFPTYTLVLKRKD
jgi:hypothetical protein